MPDADNWEMFDPCPECGGTRFDRRVIVGESVNVDPDDPHNYEVSHSETYGTERVECVNCNTVLMSPEPEEAERPSEWTYREYRETVDLHAGSILDELDEYPTDDLHRRISDSLEGAQSVIYPGWALMTVLLSDTDPDMPDYGPGWKERLDLGAGPSWGEAVGEMAYVCLYSDVMEWLKRCPDCRGMGDYYPEDSREKVDCETCDGTGNRDLEALARGAA